jgi:hypothetical protein
MKQSKNVFALLALLLFVLSGCSNKSDLLVNTWTVSEFKYSAEVPEEMKPTIEQSVANMKESFRLTYNADGTYNSKMNDQVLSGQWKMNWNSTVITSTASNGAIKDFKVIKLTKDHLSFEADEAGSKVIFVMVPAKPIAP